MWTKLKLNMTPKCHVIRVKPHTLTTLSTIAIVMVSYDIKHRVLSVYYVIYLHENDLRPITTLQWPVCQRNTYNKTYFAFSSFIYSLLDSNFILSSKWLTHSSWYLVRHNKRAHRLHLHFYNKADGAIKARAVKYNVLAGRHWFYKIRVIPQQTPIITSRSFKMRTLKEIWSGWSTEWIKTAFKCS